MCRLPRTALVTACLIFACVGPATASEGEIPWTKKINGAMKESASSGKPVFIDVWANWCVPCKEMDKTTYRDPVIVEAMHRFVPLKVDQDSSEVFCERHEVEGLPLVLYLDGEGREIGRRMGLQTTDALLASMQAVEAGYADYLQAMATVKEAESAYAVASYFIQADNADGAVDVLRRALKAAGSSERSQTLAVQLAETQLEAGDAKAASSGFKRLVDDATDEELRGRALFGLLEAQRERGRDEDADQTLLRLQSEYPELAAQVTTGE